MKNKLLVLILLLFAARSYSQVRITGRILDKRTSDPVINAIIREEGTNRGTSTNNNGEFVLILTTANAVLDIRAIGYAAEKYRLTGDSSVLIKLKSNCIRCFFDAQQVKAGPATGVLHTPAGGQLEFSFPSLKRNVTLSSGFVFQSDFSGNQFTSGSLELRHLVKSCHFDMDIHATVSFIRYKHRLKATNRNISADLNFDNVFKGIPYIRLRAGYGNLSITTDPSFKAQNFSAPIFGATTWTGRRTSLKMAAEITFYKNYPLLTAEISRRFSKLETFIRFYKLDAYKEISAGAVKTFYYYLKKNRPASERIRGRHR